MKLEKVTETDLAIVSQLIQEEFPYALFDVNMLAKKLQDESFYLFKLVENDEFLAFIEVEIVEEDIARINGLAVKPEHRKKGYGKELIEKSIEFLKEKGINIVSILVKQDNEKAKELYKKLGFEFVGLYQDEDNGTIVEEMMLELDKGKPSYVS